MFRCHPGFVGMRCEHADLLAVVASNHRQQTVATMLVLCVVGSVLLMLLCTLLKWDTFVILRLIYLVIIYTYIIVKSCLYTFYVELIDTFYEKNIWFVVEGERVNLWIHMLFSLVVGGDAEVAGEVIPSRVGRRSLGVFWRAAPPVVIQKQVLFCVFLPFAEL